LIATTNSFASAHTDDDLQTAFVVLLPRIERHACSAFRTVRCPARRDDCIAETLALSWAWFVRLAQRGINASRFVTALAYLAAQSVRSGRRLCGMEKARDVLSPRAQARHGFTIRPLPDGGSIKGNSPDDALIDKTQPRPDEEAAFRMDFPAWRSRHDERDQRLIDDLLNGDSGRDAARRCGLTPSRVSQLRRTFHDEWSALGDDRPAGTEVS
jgi:hypothetical protein